MNNPYLQIFEHFGQEAQINKLREEVDELVEAIRSGDTTHMEEEYADVKVLLTQFFDKHKFNHANITKIEHEKVLRTIDFINTGDYNKAREKARG